MFSKILQIGVKSMEINTDTEKLVENLVDKYPHMSQDEPDKRQWMADIPKVRLFFFNTAVFLDFILFVWCGGK